MIVPIPAAYLSQVTTSWNAYQSALQSHPPSMQLTCLNVLCVWLNKCNQTLGQPLASKPYPAPPNTPTWQVVPSVVVDENAEMTGELEYPD